MDKLIFGLVWEAFFIILGIMIFLVSGFSLGIFLFLLIFVLVGGIVLYQGIKKVLSDVKTNSNGEECYGIVTSIDPDEGSVQVNGRCQYKASVDFYSPTLNNNITLSESYGYDIAKYYIGECVKIKYYNNDINIIEGKIDINALPNNIQENLHRVSEQAAILEGLYTGSEDIIVINGVKYKRCDD